MNLAYVRSATVAKSYRRAIAVLALGMALWAPADAAAAATSPGPRVTIAVLPGDTSHRALGSVAGISPGAMSAGLGTAPLAQTYLDVSQGTRLFSSLYDRPLPALVIVDGEVPPPLWRIVTERAGDAPADLEPGLLATTIQDRGNGAVASPIRSPGSPA